MDSIDKEDKKNNHKLILVILGILIVPTVNSIDDLIAGLFRFLGLSIKSLLISSIVFHGLIVGVLITTLVLVVIKAKVGYGLLKRFVTLKAFRLYGVGFFLVILAGQISNISADIT